MNNNLILGLLIGIGFCIYTIIIFVIGLYLGYKAFEKSKKEKKKNAN